MASRADISVCSRFHAFDLARELSRHGMLRDLHTGYPSFIASRFGVRRSHVRSVWSGEPLNRTLAMLHRAGWIDRRDPQVAQRHDRIVASRLRPGADFFIGWAGQCRQSLEVAHGLGMTTIVERGSSHIEWQSRVLTEEARITGLPVEAPHPRTIEQELAEYEQADFIAVPSAFAMKTFVDHGVPRAKLLVNPYGVDLNLFGGSSERDEDRPDASGGLRVLHVGRVSARKGVHYLVEATRSAGASLTLVGAVDAGMSSIVSEQPGITVAGAVPGGDLPGYYRSADVFCLLSVEEGLALVIAQAMAMGLPVIATPNTGAEELIQDGVTGFIVPARDPGAAADRLRQLAADRELRHEMGRRARARVANGFSWTDYGVRARAIYTRIASRQAPAMAAR
jgi:hypothetical protein